MSGDVMNRAMEALKSGQDVEQAAYGTDSGAPAATPDLEAISGEGGAEAELDAGDELQNSIDEESHWYYNPEEGDEEGDEEEEVQEASEPSNEESEDSEDEETTGEDEVSSILEVQITDQKGRRKLKVDLNDREKVAKYVQMAALARKMQAERDQLKSSQGQLPEDVKNKVSSLDKLEEAWSGGGRQGIINVINLLGKEQGGYDKFIAAEYDRLKSKEGASPAELERIELQEKLEAESREREKLLRQMQEREERTNKQAEEADRQQLRATITPAFEKYRFEGKLGDAEAEASLDDAIWFKALTHLEELPDEVEITDRLVDKVFKEVSSKYRTIFKSQTTKKVKKAVANQKKAAGEKAAIKAMKGIKSTKKQDEFRDQMKTGDWGSALASVLTGKIKL